MLVMLLQRDTRQPSIREKRLAITSAHTSSRRILQQRSIHRRRRQVHIPHHTASYKDILHRTLPITNEHPPLAKYPHLAPHVRLPSRV